MNVCMVVNMECPRSPTVVFFLLCSVLIVLCNGEKITNKPKKERKDEMKAKEPLPDSCREEFRKLANHTMCLTDSSDVINTGVALETRHLIVSEHNRIRGEVLPPATDLTYLVWDAKLAEVAEKWARQCKQSHDLNRELPKYGATIGQNVAWGVGNWTGALETWTQEMHHYRFGEKPESYLPEGKTWEDIGHYTQMVYNTTVRLGCGFAKCLASTNQLSTQYFVCNYAAGQGFRQDFPYTKGTRCGACPDSCAKGICVCGGRICVNGGSLNLNTCHCECPPLYGGDNCKSVICPVKDAWYCGRKWGPKMCAKFVNVPEQCPYMCGICPASNSSGVVVEVTRNPADVVHEILSDYGCKLTAPRPSPAECLKLGDGGRDKPICESKGGKVGCLDCTKSKTSRNQCPVMCGLCDERADVTTLAMTTIHDSGTETLLPETCREEFRTFKSHTMCLNDNPRVRESGVAQLEKDTIVSEHNRMRSSVEPPATDLPAMVWDDNLAEVASKWARQCTNNHDKNRKLPGYGLSIGQNAAWGAANWTEAIDVWYQEVVKYRYGEDPVSYLPEGYLEIGHYTQLVYNTTVRVGCGFAKCHTTRRGLVSFYICNYAPGQGLRQDTPYINGTRCEACPDNCQDGLCQCGGRLCLNDGTLNVTSCRCSCQPVYRGDECQILECPDEDAWFCGVSMQRSACSIYANAQFLCPYMCGLCAGNSPNTTDTSTEKNFTEFPDYSKSSSTFHITDSPMLTTVQPTPATSFITLTSSTATPKTLKTTLRPSSTAPTSGKTNSQKYLSKTGKPTTAAFKTTRFYMSKSTTPKTTTESPTHTTRSTTDIPSESSRSPTTSPEKSTTPVETTTPQNTISSTPKIDKPTVSSTKVTAVETTPLTTIPSTTTVRLTTTPVKTTTTTPRTYSVPVEPFFVCEKTGKKESQESCYQYGNYGQDRSDCRSMGGSWGCEQCRVDPSFVKTFCPVMCGLCSPVCNGLRCVNGGTLDVEKCQCHCAKYFSGDVCQLVTCPRRDPWYCGVHPPPSFCDVEPYKTSVRQECPYMCGVC